MTGCPGRDRSSWTADDIFESACPSCGAMVEFFKDDARRDCPSCGGCMVNPKRALSCADWCAAADKCSLFRHAVAHAARGAGARTVRRGQASGARTRPNRASRAAP